VAGIVALLAFDLFVSGRRAHVVGVREAAGWSILDIGLAVLFGIGFGLIGALVLPGIATRTRASRTTRSWCCTSSTSRTTPCPRSRRVCRWS